MPTTHTNTKEALAAWDRAVVSWRRWMEAERSGKSEGVCKAYENTYDETVYRMPPSDECFEQTPGLTAYGR